MKTPICKMLGIDFPLVAPSHRRDVGWPPRSAGRCLKATNGNRCRAFCRLEFSYYQPSQKTKHRASRGDSRRLS